MLNKQLLNYLIEAEDTLLNTDKSIKSVPYNGFAESRYERIYINSEGAKRHIESTQASLYLYARAEQTNRKPRSGSSIRWSLGFNELDIEGCVNEAASKTVSHLHYMPIETGKYLVCFTPEAILELIGSTPKKYPSFEYFGV